MNGPEFPQSAPLNQQEQAVFEDIQQRYIMDVATDPSPEIEAFLEDWTRGSGLSGQASFYDMLAYVQGKYGLSEAEAIQSIILRQHLKLREHRRGEA